jgi:hypothetical protein
MIFSLKCIKSISKILSKPFLFPRSKSASCPETAIAVPSEAIITNNAPTAPKN